MSPKTALGISAGEIDNAIRGILAQRRTKEAARMYEMLGYFFGFLDEDLKPVEDVQNGKKFRPALCLLIAEGYGAKEKALDAALAIELFHNFTLIHDDVEDRDEYRRNRPTLWKLFGVPYAINAGDALSLIASEVAAKTKPKIRGVLFAAFAEVIDGQHIDFELGSQSVGSEASVEKYIMSIEKKTGALIGVSAEVAGIAAEQESGECKKLREYGRELGITFQLADDYRSIWNTQAETGKDAHSDIREHKRTLPFFITYKETSVKKRLLELYNTNDQLSESEISEVRTIIDATSARERVLEEIRAHAARARKAAMSLTLAESTRMILAELVDALIPQAQLR